MCVVLMVWRDPEEDGGALLKALHEISPGTVVHTRTGAIREE